MPWRKDPEMKVVRWIDMENFVRLRTTIDQNSISQEIKNVLVMWKNTRESIPAKFRPFEWNIHIILSTTLTEGDLWDTKWEEVYIARDIDWCIEILEGLENRIYKIFNIWWGKIYSSFLDAWLIDEILLTRFEKEFEWDTYFSPLDDNRKWIKN